MDQRAYLMGIFDGEGCISAYKSGRNYNLIVQVSMASPEVTALLQETWGGGIHVRKNPTAGGLILHQWYISASKAIPFLKYAVRHSIVKRRQAEIALGIAESMKKYRAGNGARKGLALSLGERYISDEDVAERERLVLELRAANGGRSRFKRSLTTT